MPMTLVELTRELHLRAVRNKYGELLQVAQREKWSYERFLCSFLDAEYRQRLENSQAKRLRTAGFPQYKYIEDLKRDELPEGIRNLLPELETLEFVRQGHNVVLYGNPGTGKTHVAIARKAVSCSSIISRSEPIQRPPSSPQTCPSTAGEKSLRTRS